MAQISGIELFETDTVDGADTDSVTLTGGGEALDTRGAVVTAFGNESASPGVLELAAGDVVGGVIDFQTAGVSQWQVDVAGSIVPQGDGTLSIGTSVARPLNIWSNEFRASSVSPTGTPLVTWYQNLTQRAYAEWDDTMGFRIFSDDAIILAPGNTQRVYFRSDGDVRYDKTYFAVYANTADGTDNESIRLHGGGGATAAGDVTRGAQLILFGNEHGDNAGGANLETNNVLKLQFGSTLDLYTAANLLWQVNTGGDISGNSSNGGNIIFNNPGKGVLDNVELGITANGTTQGAATVLTRTINEVTTSVTGVNDAVRLPTAVAGMKVYIFNAAGLNQVVVFPASGAAINGNVVDAGATLVTDGKRVFVAVSTTQWYSVGV